MLCQESTACCTSEFQVKDENTELEVQRKDLVSLKQVKKHDGDRSVDMAVTVLEQVQKDLDSPKQSQGPLDSDEHPGLGAEHLHECPVTLDSVNRHDGDQSVDMAVTSRRLKPGWMNFISQFTSQSSSAAAYSFSPVKFMRSRSFRRKSFSFILQHDELTMADVDHFWRRKWKVPSFFLVLLIMAVNWCVSTALGAASVGHVYAIGSLDWSVAGGQRSTLFIFLVIGSIFSGWNVAQYASFAIQTTGHKTGSGHRQALKLSGPFLAAANAVGWAMCVVSMFRLQGVSPMLHALLICTPAVVGGTMLKTFLKLRYILSRSRQPDTHAEDAYSAKLRQRKSAGDDCTCPFASITLRLVVRYSLGPLTCFFWTVLYAVGVRVMLLMILKLPHGKDGFYQKLGICILFAICMVFYVLGAKLLSRHINKSKGALAYSYKMIIVFNFIYNVVTGSLIRTTVIAAPSQLRAILVWCQALVDFVFRATEVRAFNRNVKLLQELERDNSAADSSAAFAATTSATSALLSAMGDLCDINVGNLAFAAMSCFFPPDIGMQSDCDGGFVMTTWNDSYPEWLINFVEILFLVYYCKMPCLYYYSMLDPFIVVCMLLVVYVQVCLVVFTALISF
eukprot:TRINITY_DN5569_c0_g4_i1.p1 TRINITY_DN5569_c0_g4~~TRINITY_DN5569_c0_g4_i1.p1  ORF type:complete len:664 (-),score=91.14 TRINITY_DN5569_c0_g4_i1:173-2032(-)